MKRIKALIKLSSETPARNIMAEMIAELIPITLAGNLCAARNQYKSPMPEVAAELKVKA